MEESIAYAPATVANVCCGFDRLGFALESPGDVIAVRRLDQGLKIKAIHGAELSFNANENVASVSAQSFLDRKGIESGLEIEIWKGYPVGSGIGSSSASAVAAAVATASLFGFDKYDPDVLQAALDGEEVASKSRHADNVGPCLLGGWVIANHQKSIQCQRIETTLDLRVVILHPHIEVKTSDSRRVLPKSVALDLAIKQAGHFGLMIHALHSGDVEVLGNSLKDEIIEPYRKELLLAFDKTKEVALSNGAFGGGISGSGP
ncbi:MAG: homoserine kinase, partial [Flavobacteriales bacterium]|nr:homoserine kinase [Flavobacteriales bacterium]